MVKTQVTSADRFARLARGEAERWRPGQADRRREGRSPLRPGHAALRLRERRAGRRAAHGRSLLADRLCHRGLLSWSAASAASTRRCSGSSPGPRRARWRCRPASATRFRERAQARHPVRCARPSAACAADLRERTEQVRRGMAERRRPEPLGPMCNDESSGERPAVRIPLLPLRQPHRGRRTWFCMAEPNGLPLLLRRQGSDRRPGGGAREGGDVRRRGVGPAVLQLRALRAPDLPGRQRARQVRPAPHLRDLLRPLARRSGSSPATSRARRCRCRWRTSSSLNGVEDEAENARRRRRGRGSRPRRSAPQAKSSWQVSSASTSTSTSSVVL